MRGRHVGTLSPDDPLHGFLAATVHAVLGLRIVQPAFEVTQLDRAGTVYRYRERSGAADLVGKFFGAKLAKSAAPALATLLRHEFEGLHQLRALGLDAPPHRVVRPLAMSEAIGFVLVEDFAEGSDLDSFIVDAATNSGAGELGPRIDAVAGFLADLHTRSATDEPLSDVAGLAYLGKLTEQLESRGVLTLGDQARLDHIHQQWAASKALIAPVRALLHGDPTPPHFLFDRNEGLTVMISNGCDRGIRRPTSDG